jgi:predicted ferric reductase
MVAVSNASAATPSPLRQRRWVLDWAQAVVFLNGGVILALWLKDQDAATLRTTAGQLTAAGRIAGLLGAYLVLVQLLLMARIPALDRAVGLERLAAWHRRAGFWCLWLLLAHPALLLLGYAASDQRLRPWGLLREAWDLEVSYPDVLLATVALALLVAAAVASVRAVRRRMAYETWYFVHLYTYLAVALSFSHQLADGEELITHPLTRAYWSALYLLTLGALLLWRVGLPLARAARHRLRVAGVVDEAPGVFSIYLTGRHLERLPVLAGQFFLWRFLTRERWWQARPLSLSAAPNGRWLRITVKGLSDDTRALRRLAPGTRVLAEGPYGAFTDEARSRDKVLLIAGGIGITPLRALLEGIPLGVHVALLYRCRRPGEVIFRSELEQLVRWRGGSVRYLHEARGDPRDPWRPLGPATIRWLVPDVATRDVYLCGPPGLLEDARRSLRTLGVPEAQIHCEQFAF